MRSPSVVLVATLAALLSFGFSIGARHQANAAPHQSGASPKPNSTSPNSAGTWERHCRVVRKDCRRKYIDDVSKMNACIAAARCS